MRSTGKVKWYDETKGYGFIIRDGGAGDVFVHRSALAGSGRVHLVAGELVEFDVAQDPKGPQAKNVTVRS